VEAAGYRRHRRHVEGSDWKGARHGGRGEAPGDVAAGQLPPGGRGRAGPHHLLVQGQVPGRRPAAAAARLGAAAAAARLGAAAAAAGAWGAGRAGWRLRMRGRRAAVMRGSRAVCSTRRCRPGQGPGPLEHMGQCSVGGRRLPRPRGAAAGLARVRVLHAPARLGSGQGPGQRRPAAARGRPAARRQRGHVGLRRRRVGGRVGGCGLGAQRKRARALRPAVCVWAPLPPPLPPRRAEAGGEHQPGPCSP
jgi:hypothetical protein